MGNQIQTKQDRAQAVIDGVLNGNSLREAIANAGIDIKTFHNIIQSDKQSALAYAHAQELRGDVLADEVIHIADTEQDAAKARNMISARQWLSGKLNKRYGDRIDLNVTATLDVTSALAEARQRVTLPVRDQQQIVDVDSRILPRARAPSAPDGESGTRPDVPDIFS